MSMLQVVLNFIFNQKISGTSVKEALDEEHLTTVKKLHEPAGDAFVYSSGESSPTYHEALRLLSSLSDLAGALSSCIKSECSLDQLSLHQLLHDKLCGLQK